MLVGEGGVFFSGALHALLNELGLPTTEALLVLPLDVEDALELIEGNPS